MKALFDTSVLVAAFEVSHPRHSVCLPWLQRVQVSEIDGYLSTHTFALTLFCSDSLTCETTYFANDRPTFN
jgi:predicted nucleic acid-binding protein